MEMVEDSIQRVIGDFENKDCHMEKKKFIRWIGRKQACREWS